MTSQFRQGSVARQTPPMDYIELLTTDDDGNAIPGPKFPVDRGAAVQYRDPGVGVVDDIRLAYRHKFFRYDEARQPMPDTLIEFFVPDWLLIHGQPSNHCLRLVTERMGWTDRPS